MPLEEVNVCRGHPVDLGHAGHAELTALAEAQCGASELGSRAAEGASRR
jgi:hypothetical protein